MTSWEINHALTNDRGVFCSYCTLTSGLSEADMADGVVGWQCECGEWNALTFEEHPPLVDYSTYEDVYD